MKAARLLGVAALGAFVCTIPAANWTLDRYGFRDVPGLGPVASGVVWIGLAFVLRDVAQLIVGKWAVLGGLAVGAVLSWWLADPFIAKASLVSFAIAETLDWVIYTPLADRRFIVAVVASSIVGAVLDSILFLYVAFDSTHGWWQLAFAKCVIVAVATPLAWAARRALSDRQLGIA